MASGQQKAATKQAPERNNRVYYDKCFTYSSLAESGQLLDEQKAGWDRVSLAEDRNDFLEYFGCDQHGSNFHLQLSVVSLLVESADTPNESKYRLARASLTYFSASKGQEFAYKTEQLLDYALKRQNPDHPSKNIYRVGSLSVETVQAFSLSRILFNGTFRHGSEFVPARLAISTHPIGDKFDYLQRTQLGESAGWQMEDRIDSSLMYQCELELFGGADGDKELKVMWGVKSKRFIDPREVQVSDEREHLYAWSECGHFVALSRPIGRPELVYGMVDSGYEYASQLTDCRLMLDGHTQAEFGQLGRLVDLPVGAKLTFVGFESKRYELELVEGVGKGGLLGVRVNKFPGFGCTSVSDPPGELLEAQKRLWLLDIHDRRLAHPLVSERLLGGKGSSLVELSRRLVVGDFSLASCSPSAPMVSVPRGLVLSCQAYRLWLHSDPRIAVAIGELDAARRSLAASSLHLNPWSAEYLSMAQRQQMLREHSQRTCELLRSCPLPEPLRLELHQRLLDVFGQLELAERLFAVRSSAVGEDSLETSAAGQMATILDARGIDSICAAVVACWTSQFSPEALTYKSQNGLALNAPMGVVVQERVQCRAAGVAATCDPLTGNKRRLEISANRGLGEGVVAGGRADTVRVHLDSLAWDELNEEPSGYLRPHGLRLDKVPAECCLADEHIVALANLLLWLRRSSDVQEREVEWGLTGGVDGHAWRLHLLQSRPLTNLGRLSARETDHELDYGLVGPREKVSRANVGEVMPGALCPLNSTFFLPASTNRVPEKPFCAEHTQVPFASSNFAFHGQLVVMVLNFTDTIARFKPKDSSEEERQSLIALKMMLGTQTDDDHNVDYVSERLNPQSRIERKALLKLMALDLGGIQLQLMRNDSNLRNILLQEAVKDDDPLKVVGLFERLTSELWPLSDAWAIHITATVVSMVLNILCMKVMSSQAAYESVLSSELLNDFSVLMRQTDPGAAGTESGDISKLLERLAACMAASPARQEILALEDQSAASRRLYEHLSAGDSQEAKLYREFMETNGHRAFKEFDLASSTWADDPSFVIKSLLLRLRQGVAQSPPTERHEDRSAEIERVLAKISRGRTLLTGYLLPRARSAVVRRERTKSRLIRTVDKYRQGFRHLAGLLCAEGRLPSAELIFQLTIEEIRQLIVEPESELSRLLYKARRRQQRNRILNQTTFPRPVIAFQEMVALVNQVTGAESAPAGAHAQPAEAGKGSVVGVTSCAGRVTGRACVVRGLEDMEQVEQDDILVTYSIDISWSVYFFALAGIVTEVGGIVSHGAVVAREYGIPTLCTAMGACSTFKTGDTITLDASKGICYLAEPAG